MARQSYTLNQYQQALLSLLQVDNPRRPPIWKRSRHEFVLEYGSWYEPVATPKGIEAGRAGQCFVNAFNLASDNESLTYCEGYIVHERTGMLIHHAWVTDGSGCAIDNTLDRPAAAYAGVPFHTNYVRIYHLRNEAIICLLDDYLHDWPLLGELGDKPEEWLEPKGEGIARMSSQ